MTFWDDLLLDASLEGETFAAEPPDTNEELCRLLGIRPQTRFAPQWPRPEWGRKGLLSKREREEILLETGVLPPAEVEL